MIFNSYIQRQFVIVVVLFLKKSSSYINKIKLQLFYDIFATFFFGLLPIHCLNMPKHLNFVFQQQQEQPQQQQQQQRIIIIVIDDDDDDDDDIDFTIISSYKLPPPNPIIDLTNLEDDDDDYIIDLTKEDDNDHDHVMD